MKDDTNNGRRAFLKLSGVSAALAATASFIHPSIAKALSISANNASGTIMDVEHIIVLTQENRSFDHYFGTMAGVRGFGDRHPIPTVNGNVWWQRFEHEGETRLLVPYHLDSRIGNAQRVDGTPHLFNDAQQAWHEGRIDAWPTYKKQQSMGYYNEAEVQFQFALANAFTICDAYHCSFHGGTNPNRLFLWTGINHHADDSNPPAIDNSFDSLGSPNEGYQWDTYPERLEEAGIRWKVYQNLPDNFTDNSLAGFVNYRQANKQRGNLANGAPYPRWTLDDEGINPLLKGVSNTMPDLGFLASLREDIAAGTLPQVSWIVAPAKYSEHPGPSSPVQGGWYMQEVLDALTERPDVWSKTVLIINFDENDGFFDHLPPPSPPTILDGNIQGICNLDAKDEYHDDGRPYGPGPRVPALVVSPWSRGGWVNSQVFDHTSVLRFIEARFGVVEKNISPYRRAICGDMQSTLNFSNPNDETIPTLPMIEKSQAIALVKQQEAMDQVLPPAVEDQRLPIQNIGVRPSRALPYELHVNAEQLTVDRMMLKMSNTGSQGMIIHVYNKLELDAVPRRYVIDSQETLEDEWLIDPDKGYDLWLLGPNGYHRAFAGTASLDHYMEVSVCYDLTEPTLLLTLTNHSDNSLTLMLDNRVYLGNQSELTLAPRQERKERIACTKQAGWYDFTIHSDAGLMRRYAGRIETGKHSVSDPMMGNVK